MTQGPIFALGEKAALMVVWTLVISLALVGVAHAVLRPYAYVGEVTGKGPEGATIQIETEYTWGSSGWQTDSAVLEGAAPNEDALNEIRVGDYVLATSLGNPGGFWTTLATMESSAEWVVTHIYGDPDYVWDIPLLGDYAIGYDNIPDCSSCDGCNCEAAYTTVSITDTSGGSETRQLSPGDSYRYQSVDITFLSGQAPSSPKCTNAPCMGPQPVSNFVIYIGGDTESLTSDAKNGGSDSDCFISTVIYR